jgi:hypothetical protein
MRQINLLYWVSVNFRSWLNLSCLNGILKAVKVRFSAKFKTQLSEKLMDLGNLALAGLAFGQFISNKPFSLMIFIGGVLFSVSCYMGSYVVSSK